MSVRAAGCEAGLWRRVRMEKCVYLQTILQAPDCARRGLDLHNLM